MRDVAQGGFASLLGPLSLAPAQDAASCEDVKGARFRACQLVVTVGAFDCEAVVGTKGRMTLTAAKQGVRPELFDATRLSIDNGRGTSYRAIPLPGAVAGSAQAGLRPEPRSEFSRRAVNSNRSRSVRVRRLQLR